MNITKEYTPMAIPSKLTSDNYMFDNTRTALYGSTGAEFKRSINNHEAKD